MNKTGDLIEENMNNLQSLWCTVGAPFEACHFNRHFSWCVVADSDWPNRLWFQQDATLEGVKAAKTHLQSLTTRLIVPYWDIYSNRSWQLLEANGFERLSEQVAMYLPLTHPFGEQDDLLVKRVDSPEKAQLWTRLFREAFNYRISEKLLFPGQESVRCFIAFHQHEPAGTVLLHHTGNNVLGIHAMGIIPSMRRKGLAQQLMKKILNQSLEEGFRYATLQASAMGKDLYLKLGFIQQFALKNYALPAVGR